MDLMEKIVSLCKRRGFVYPGSEIYGGLSNSWDFGPLGIELKNNFKQLWWKTFVHGRDDILGLDAAIIMNPKVWEASGHIAGFSDPLRECKLCNTRLRPDIIDEFHNSKVQGVGNVNPKSAFIEQLTCPKAKDGKHVWGEVKQFNMMLKTHLGPVEDSASVAYLRPETAQGMFIDFKNILSSFPKKLPFGIAQIGKAFRNEITTGNFLFRLRELEQMEIEYFISSPKKDEEWQKYFEEWRKEMWRWFDLVGIDGKKVHEHEIPGRERAHYSKRTIDFEFDYPFGTKELYGLAYRTDYDLTSHQKYSGQDLSFHDQETGESYIPHVIEPTWGVDRTLLAILLSSYYEDEKRVVLKLKPYLAPYKVAIFPLVANKEDIMIKAQSVYKKIKPQFTCIFDGRGNIGKRYYAQDEIGTPWCVTIDYDTLKDDTVTVRDRDTAIQERIAIDKLDNYFNQKLNII
ncbi:glycine--tRNA ligase [Candidatus Gottesmanbacteria bacterium]|nr:glycine--tRNA ligase [Candidatus Gottesmanbacteria bacterium]